MADHGQLLHIDERTGSRLRDGRPASAVAEGVAECMRAMSDPTRLNLALALRGEVELCVCDLSWIAERPQNLVSHHMKTLKAAGVVVSHREGKMTMYALTETGRALADSAAALAAARERAARSVV